MFSVWSSRTVTTAWLAPCVFGDVGQRLGDDEVRDGFDSVGQALGQIDVQRRRHARGGALHHRRQRGVQAAVGEDRRCDAAHHVAQFDQCALGVVVGLGDQLAPGGRRSVSSLVWARPIVIASDTSRGCTLSCRSRSMRCRSVCADDTAPSRASVERVHLVLQHRGWRRRQQPAVDRGVDDGARTPRSRRRPPARRSASSHASVRRNERQSCVVVAAVDRHRGGRCRGRRTPAEQRDDRRPRGRRSSEGSGVRSPSRTVRY